MKKPARLRARELLRLAWATAFALCATHAATELHLHDAAAPDEFCTACTFAQADLASTSIDAGAPAPGWAPGTAARLSGVAVAARPFEAERSRAPPLHF